MEGPGWLRGAWTLAVGARAASVEYPPPMSSWRAPAAALCRVGSYVVGIGGVIWIASSAPAVSGDPAAERIVLGVVASLAAAAALHLAALLLEGREAPE